QGRVRELRLGDGGRPRPAGRGHVPSLQAGLAGTGTGLPRRTARVVPGTDRAAPGPAGADRSPAWPGARGLRRGGTGGGGAAGGGGGGGRPPPPPPTAAPRPPPAR